MRFIILCELKKNSGATRKSLRLAHLEYLQKNQGRIVFGGPALDEQNTPEMMIIVTEFADKKSAENFIGQEPYTASGEVFESVKVRTWSQVLPETHENALGEEVEKERTTQQTK